MGPNHGRIDFLLRFIVVRGMLQRYSATRPPTSRTTAPTMVATAIKTDSTASTDRVDKKMSIPRPTPATRDPAMLEAFANTATRVA